MGASLSSRAIAETSSGSISLAIWVRYAKSAEKSVDFFAFGMDVCGAGFGAGGTDLTGAGPIGRAGLACGTGLGLTSVGGFDHALVRGTGAGVTTSGAFLALVT